MLLRQKFFTFISLVGISLTLVVLLIATAMLDAVFAPRAPESRADRILGVYQLTMRGKESLGSGRRLPLLGPHGARTLPGVERSSLFTVQQTRPLLPGRPQISSYLKHTDGDYWRILDFDFLEGAPFTAADEAAGIPVAVINETTRRRFFRRRPALGRPFDIDGQHFRVVGVVRDVPIIRYRTFSDDLWVPIRRRGTQPYKQDHR